MTPEQVQKFKQIVVHGQQKRKEQLKKAAAAQADIDQRRKELKEVGKL